MSLQTYTGSLTLGTAGQQLAPNADGICVVDLSATTFIDSYAIVLAALDIVLSSGDGQHVSFIEPQRESVRNYLSRMHVDRLLYEHGVAHELPTIRELNQDGFLIPLTSISGRRYEALGNLVATRMHEYEDVDSEIVASVSEAIFELGANAEEHSRTNNAFIAAQVYLRGTQNAYVVGAIGDIGIGLKRSLVRYGPANDGHAISLAITEGVSGTGSAHRGIGLSALVDSCRNFRGTVAVMSGSSERLIYAYTETPFHSAKLRGTLVGFKLPLRPGRRSR